MSRYAIKSFYIMCFTVSSFKEAISLVSSRIPEYLECMWLLEGLVMVDQCWSCFVGEQWLRWLPECPGACLHWWQARIRWHPHLWSGCADCFWHPWQGLPHDPVALLARSTGCDEKRWKTGSLQEAQKHVPTPTRKGTFEREIQSPRLHALGTYFVRFHWDCAFLHVWLQGAQNYWYLYNGWT